MTLIVISIIGLTAFRVSLLFSSCFATVLYTSPFAVIVVLG